MWAQVEPLLPAQYGKGRPFRDHRQVIEGVVYHARERRTCKFAS
ncbi:transposase [Actinomycetospora rhizophila]|uniref:Transposase n=1 Tax=Actinomycetospora rhizophila TaxID=1416876 RepID=A0ABV9ZNF1_9PSEU